MFAFCVALVVLINFGVNSQQNSLVHSNTADSATLFGQLHYLLSNQPKISCHHIRANIKNAHPTDSTKYVICRDEQHYDVFTCSNGGIFNNTQKACLDLCQQNNPCLNQGQCIILPDLTLQCVCRRDWTGEQCETPLSSCVNNPCGPDGECRMLKASDYSQDYVCICNKQKFYGRNCQQTVPNPCLLNAQQFHPFAYSRRAYINCDDELIFFQPCNANLYWNQEHKRCDRELPLLLRAPFIDLKWRNQQGKGNHFIGTANGPSRVFHLTGFSSSNLAETVTVPSRVFHLSGFASNNFEQHNAPWSNNNKNNQLQTSENFQSWQNQNKRTSTTQESQIDQWTASLGGTAKVPTSKVPQEMTVHFMSGWQSNQQKK